MSRTTLETKYNNFIDSINKVCMEDKIKYRTTLIENIAKCKDWKMKLEYEEQLSTLNDEIDKYETNQNEYFLDTMNLFDNYTSLNTPASSGDKCLLDIFNKKDVNTAMNKGKLYDKYLKIVENTCNDTIEENQNYICKKCNIPFVMSQNESLMLCESCGEAEPYFDINVQGMTYEQEINSEVNVSFSYKRINHFNEWLAQFQAKESTEIPSEIIDKLINEFKKERITNASQITQKKVKEYLKKLNYNKFYEHATHITNLLNGKKPPTMTPMLEEKLRNMFRQIQVPFEKHKPPTRCNFLSYSYCLYKFCELLNEDEFMTQFHLLKSREKLYQQDCIWKNICTELSWEFIPTI